MKLSKDRIIKALRDTLRREQGYKEDVRKVYFREQDRANAYRATMNRIVVAYAEHGSSLSHAWIAKQLAEHLK